MTKLENEKQYESAMKRINELLEFVGEDTPEDDFRSVELVLLSNLVADYEDEHYPIKKPTLIDVLKLRMYEMGLNQCALAAMLGMNQSKLSEIISGKCEPTLKQARTMAQKLNISASIVLGV
jgi:HTH-type transcriptional regulator/antitoxin HigA